MVPVNWWSHIKHFTKEEMACKCGCGKADMQKRTMLRLDQLRARLGRPIRVTSAYRCADHNKAVGGAPGSKHLTGEAADLALTGNDAFNGIALAIHVGFKGIGVAKTFIHVDDGRDTGTVWSY